MISERLKGKFDNAEPGIEDFLQKLPDNFQLTNNILYNDRTEGFKYTNVLQEKTFIKGLLNWLDTIEPDRDFDFTDEVNEVEEENEVIVKENHCITIDETKFKGYVFDYIALDAWWEHLHDLKNTLKKIIERE